MTPEPFGYFKPDPFGWTDCAEADEGARPLYDQDTVDALLAEINAERALSFRNQVAELEKQRDELQSELEAMKQSVAIAATCNHVARMEQAEKQRDELLAVIKAIEINAEECMDFDEFTAMLVPIDDYHKLIEAIASVKGRKCETCGGHGEIGGFVNAESGYQSEPCPDCAIASTKETK